MAITTHYDNLQVKRTASPEVIRGAYRQLAQKWHPDRNPGNREEAERILKIVNRAYEVLSDPQLRRQHDEWIKAQESVQHEGVNSTKEDEEIQEASTDQNSEQATGDSAPPRANFKAKIRITYLLLPLLAGFFFWNINKSEYFPDTLRPPNVQNRVQEVPPPRELPGTAKTPISIGETDDSESLSPSNPVEMFYSRNNQWKSFRSPPRARLTSGRIRADIGRNPEGLPTAYRDWVRFYIDDQLVLEDNGIVEFVSVSDVDKDGVKDSFVSVDPGGSGGFAQCFALLSSKSQLSTYTANGACGDVVNGRAGGPILRQSLCLYIESLASYLDPCVSLFLEFNGGSFSLVPSARSSEEIWNNLETGLINQDDGGKCGLDDRSFKLVADAWLETVFSGPPENAVRILNEHFKPLCSNYRRFSCELLSALELSLSEQRNMISATEVVGFTRNFVDAAELVCEK